MGTWICTHWSTTGCADRTGAPALWTDAFSSEGGAGPAAGSGSIEVVG